MYYLMNIQKKTFKDSFFILKYLRIVVDQAIGLIKSLCLLVQKLFGKISYYIDGCSLFTLKNLFL